MDFELKDFEMYNAVSRESEKYQTKEFRLFFVTIDPSSASEQDRTVN